MRVKLLRQLRRECANRYIAVYDCINGAYGWYLEDCDGCLYSGCCVTKEIALDRLKTLWHKEAIYYLNCYKDRTKTNYVW